MEFKVVYTIGETSYYNKGGVDIKSNIADDELVICQISKTLVDHLKKGSAILEPDKLLLGFAEAQKRDIQDNLGALNEIELNIKNMSDSIQAKLLVSCEDNEQKYLELEEKFTETSSRINKIISGTSQSLDKDVEKVGLVYEKLNKINDYGLGNLISTIGKVLELAEKDKDLVKLVLEHVK